jgi:hypothetical protein
MHIQFTTFGVLTTVLMGLTVWLVVSRFTKTLESNWPLVYYLGVVIYSKVFEGVLEPYWVFVGVVSALFLRFEFMGGFFLKFVRSVEAVVLVYFLWRGLSMSMW